MTAYAYIKWSDVPQALIDSSRQHVDSITGAKIVTFEGSPFAGEIWKHRALHDSGETVDVIYPFPRDRQSRNSLVAWLMNWGIHFRVVM